MLVLFVSVNSSRAGNANEVSAYGMCVSRSLEEDRELLRDSMDLLYFVLPHQQCC